MRRAFGTIGLLTALVAGCQPQQPAPPEEPPDAYPVRSDRLVVNVPTGVQPTKWYTPGYPPLALLDQPKETLKGDDALLVGQRVIINTRDAEPDVRGEFAKVLGEMFGTPAAPHMPDPAKLIEQLKLEDKLNSLRETYKQTKANVDALKAAAKTPDDLQTVEVIEKQATAQAADVRKSESRIEALRTADDALHLDPETLKRGGVLYRNYCQQCHGLTGDGNGPGGKFLIPLPRDYRQGIFKFITTDPKVEGKRKPSRKDLYRTITKGMDGSPMPQFGALKDDEVNDIISYVIHLSVRGEAEYDLMKKAADTGGDGIEPQEVRKGLYESVAQSLPLWVQSDRTPIVPVKNPYMTAEQQAEAAARGYTLFTDPAVGCTTCHTAYGRSAPYQFDSWASIVRPRNLTVPTLRGGRSPEDIYARIYGGVLGSNMPSHDKHEKLRPPGDGTDKIWDLVYFVRYLSESAGRQELNEKFQIEIDP